MWKFEVNKYASASAAVSSQTSIIDEVKGAAAMTAFRLSQFIFTEAGTDVFLMPIAWGATGDGDDDVETSPTSATAAATTFLVLGVMEQHCHHRQT